MRDAHAQWCNARPRTDDKKWSSYQFQSRKEGNQREAGDYVKFDEIEVNKSAIRRKTRDARSVAGAMISGRWFRDDIYV